MLGDSVWAFGRGNVPCADGLELSEIVYKPSMYCVTFLVFFRVRVSCPLISTWERRVWPVRWPWGANTAGTRYSGDIVVECTNDRRTDSRCVKMLVRTSWINWWNCWRQTASTLTSTRSHAPPSQSPRLCQEPWWQYYTKTQLWMLFV